MQHLDDVFSAVHADVKTPSIVKYLQLIQHCGVQTLNTCTQFKPDVTLFNRAHPPLPPPQQTKVSKQVIKLPVYTRGQGFRGQCFPSMCIRHSLQ